MPVKNGMPYLPLALESIARQAYQNYTLLVCDNGSTDGTVEMLRWSTPLSNGTLTNADVALWDTVGFPDGITNLAVYLIDDKPVRSEDCTGPHGGVGLSFCSVPGARIVLDIRDATAGTYGFQLDRTAFLTQVDTISSGTLVSVAPEPATLRLL